MIDCGGSLTFRQQVLPLLRERGINRLDCLVLTHGDSAHIGAAPYLLNYLTPKWLIESRLENRARIYPEIQQIVATRRINRMQIETGQKLRWGDHSYWEPLYPGTSYPPTGVADDGSLVLRLKTGLWKILLTSDCGFLIEQQLIEEKRSLNADIWIRGQHSETPSGSQEFLEKIAPKMIIASHSRFPPHEKLSDEWINHVEKAGIQLIKLDAVGTVNIEITDSKITVKPFLTGERFELRR
jgi:competence protein ComEC